MICVVTMSGSNDPPFIIAFLLQQSFWPFGKYQEVSFLHNFESFKLCGRKILFVFLLLLFLLYLKYVHGLIQHTLHVFFFSREGICEESKTSRLILDQPYVVGQDFLLMSSFQQRLKQKVLAKLIRKPIACLNLI